MGYSWVVAIELRVPKKKSWLASTPDPADFDDWPELLQSEPKQKQKVSALLAALAKDDLAKVEWNDDELVVSAILDDGGSLWIDRRALLAAAVRTSGGKGQLAIVNAFDNTEETAVVVEGSGKTKVLKGKERTALQKRLAKLEKALGEAHDAAADVARRAEHLVRDEKLRSVHAKILRALAKIEEAQLLAAARKVKGTFLLVPKPGTPNHGTFASLYDSAPALLHALAHGDRRVHAWEAARFVTGALQILDQVAPDHAATFAKEVLAARARHPASKTILDLALAIESRASGDDVDTALGRLRKELPDAHYLQQPAMLEHPIVVAIGKKKSQKTRAAILTQLEKVIGAPTAWKAITEKDASFGYVLTHLLEKQKHPDDRALLRALWAHPHWMIANQMKARAK